MTGSAHSSCLRPRSGKTQLLKDIANGIPGNHPDVHTMVVLEGPTASLPDRSGSSLRVWSIAQLFLLLKMLSAVGQIEGTELLLQRLGKTTTNKEFLASIAKAMEADSKS